MIKEIKNYNVVRPFTVEDAEQILALAKEGTAEIRLYLASYMAVDAADYVELSPEEFVEAINGIVVPV